MKLSRTLSILAAAAVMSVPAFAAPAAGTISSLKGSASSPKPDGSSVELKVGGQLHEGDIVVVPQGSALEMQLPGGGVVVFGPGTRTRVLALQAGDTGVSSVDLALIRGSISGDATGNPTGSSFAIRTTNGVANVSGTQFSTVFEPSSITNGQLTLVVAAGTASVMPVNGFNTIAVPTGDQIVIGGRNPNPQPMTATPNALALAKGGPFIPTSPVAIPTLPTGPAIQQQQNAAPLPNVAITSPVEMSPTGSAQVL